MSSDGPSTKGCHPFGRGAVSTDDSGAAKGRGRDQARSEEAEARQLELDALLDDDESNCFDEYDRNDNGSARIGVRAADADACSSTRHSNGQPTRTSRLDTPQRVEPPMSFNAPPRPAEQTREQQIKMSDYHMLAFSSQRSGRHEMEGLAHYSSGVTMDSMGQYAKALESYKKFQGVCKTLNDPLIEGVCHNCMGVDYMLIACPPGSNAEEKAGDLSTRPVAMIKAALAHHEAHLKVADDVGIGVAHSNIGLCHGLLGDYATAAKNHQEALRAALRIQSIGAQSVAVGNLGTLAMRRGDACTAQACLEQHLQLVQQAGDWQAEISAWSKLAQLAANRAGSANGARSKSPDPAPGHYGDRDGRDDERDCEGQDLPGVQEREALTRSLRCYEKATALAKVHSEVSTLKRLHCDMGIVRGNATMDEYFRDLHERALNVRAT